MPRRTRKQKPRKRRTVRTKRVRGGSLFNSVVRAATTVNPAFKSQVELAEFAKRVVQNPHIMPILKDSALSRQQKVGYLKWELENDTFFNEKRDALQWACNHRVIIEPIIPEIIPFLEEMCPLLAMYNTVKKSDTQYSLKITGGGQSQFKIVYNGKTEITKHPQTLTANPIVQTAPTITYPSHLKSHVLLLTDPDAVYPEHLHWLVENGKPLLDYQGPRPPDQKVHRYIFKLYRKQKQQSQPLKVPTERPNFDSIQFEKDNQLLLLETRIFLSSHQ